MYTPKFNQVSDRAILIEAMRAYSFAVVFGPMDFEKSFAPPHATHLPLVISDEGPYGILEGHFAKANPHWQSLADRETLIIFSGPHSYVSPLLYAERLSVPTWNYVAIHARGRLELIEDEAAKSALLAGAFRLFTPPEHPTKRRWPLGCRG